MTEQCESSQDSFGYNDNFTVSILFWYNSINHDKVIYIIKGLIIQALFYPLMYQQLVVLGSGNLTGKTAKEP